jgi:hypothetical protein
MTMKSASLFIVLCVAMVLIGSGPAQNMEKTSAADGKSGARSPIFQPLGAATSTSMRSAHLSGASIGGGYGEELGGMEMTLQQYRAAIENLSLPQVRQVWPGLDRHREGQLKEAFQYLRSMSSTPRMGLECGAPAVIEESTWVQCRETLTYNDAKGKPKDVKPARVSILLRRQGNNWIVDTMK